jgi:radical SAM protein
MAGTDYSRSDLHHSPMLVFYETTRACDLKCVHCRADAQTSCHPDELSTGLARRLIDQMCTFAKRPLLVLTGGDPLKRADIFELVEHASARGLEVAMTPSATPLVTPEAITRLRSVGLHRFAVSLDGADAAVHDGFRRVEGSFDRTLRIIADARAAGLPVQVNTTITRGNVHQLDAIADILGGLDIVLWSVFFLIPTGRGQVDQRLDGEQVEEVFRRLWEHARRQAYAIKTTEAPHYRRFILQQRRASGGGRVGAASGHRRVGTNDGKGVVFVSHTGEIYPSGFLPICCGKFPLDSLVRVYQESTLFRMLRDAEQLGGKCGVCEYRHVCGGSRSRAYAIRGDPLGEEPDCAYIPRSITAADAVQAG